MNMRIASLLCVTILVAPSTQAQAPLGPASDGRPTFADFEKRVGGYPYKASPERTAAIKKGLPLLKKCMTKTEVDSLLGAPDFSQSNFGPKGPGEKWLGFGWTYYLAKRAETTNLNDPRVEIFFDTSDRAHWIVPSHIDGSHEIGAPNEKCA